MKPEIYEKNVTHMFRNAPGHLMDSEDNRQLLIEVSSNEANCIGKDGFGNLWYAAIVEERGQVWALVYDGSIRNGGLNRPPRDIVREQGLAPKREKP